MPQSESPIRSTRASPAHYQLQVTSGDRIRVLEIELE
jgi:hypothetical protein